MVNVTQHQQQDGHCRADARAEHDVVVELGWWDWCVWRLALGSSWSGEVECADGWL